MVHKIHLAEVGKEGGKGCRSVPENKKIAGFDEVGSSFLCHVVRTLSI